MSGIQNIVSAAPVVPLKIPDCRHNRLSQSLQAKQDSFALDLFIIPAFNKSRLIAMIDGYKSLSLLHTMNVSVKK